MPIASPFSSARTGTVLGLVAGLLFLAAAGLRVVRAGHVTPEAGYLLAAGAFWILLTRRKARERGAAPLDR